MPGQFERRSDRRLLVAVAGILCLGVVIFLLGLWVLLHLHGDRGDRLALGVLVGPIFIVLAASEVIHRVRNGPQQPGRHMRED